MNLPAPFTSGLAACLIACVGQICCGSAQALDKIRDGFMEQYDALNADRDKGLEDLKTNYVNALQRLLNDVKQAGNLDPVVTIRDEITSIQTGTDPLRELPKSSPRKLVDLRSKFSGARTAITNKHASELAALAGKVEKALTQIEATLTRAGEVDAALAARRMRESLDEDPAIRSARSADKSAGQDSPDRAAIVETTRSFKKFEKGVALFSNRKYVWTLVPKEFSGHRVSFAAGGSRKPLELDVKEAGLLRVVAEGEDYARLKQDGWKPVGRAGRGGQKKDTPQVMEKAVGAGSLKLESVSFLGVRLLLDAE